jgi:hypothetical protein
LQPVCPYVAVEHLSQAELVGQAYDSWNVVNAFMVEKQCLCHAASLSQNSQ